MAATAPSDRTSALSTVIFDLGGVVLGWAPHRAYEQVLPAEEVPGFLNAIDFWEWNRALDAGLPYAEAERRLVERFPHLAEAVTAYRRHFDRTLTGMVTGTGAVIAELEQAGIRLLALTNWSAETFPVARARFGLLRRFEGIVVSGEEKLCKPDPAVFELLCERFQVTPTGCVFVDDSVVNVAAAADLGMTALHFTDATTLRRDLQSLDLLGDRPPVSEPLFHLTERSSWQEATRTGSFPWSSRGLSYEQEGFVHCSYAHQVARLPELYYSDVDPDELVVLELDVRDGSAPVLAEEIAPGTWLPHVYAPLPVDHVSSVHPLSHFLRQHPAP
jgi:2-haloacid dehalogenase